MHHCAMEIASLRTHHHNGSSTYRGAKGGTLYLVFCPRTGPKTFLRCFALKQRNYKAKHSRNVQRHVLGQKKIKIHSFSELGKIAARDGTRNSSSLDPRGPGPFFTPRFPEEYILSLLGSSRSSPKLLEDLEN